MFDSVPTHFYIPNFYPDVGSGHPQLCQFLSGKSPPGFCQNIKISIRTALRHFKKILKFLSGSGNGI
jgi:hypothetical protein